MEKEVKLYSTGCPKCEVLKKKLAQKGIEYVEISDENKLISLGITHIPQLSVNDGELMDFTTAVDFVNSYEGEN